MKYTILVGGIHIESSTFTPYISGEKDFTITRGEGLLKRYPWFEKYREKAKLIPLTHARALPGGVVDEQFFDQWFQDFMEHVDKAMRMQTIHGILLDIHGAMAVENRMDAEGYLAKELRKKVGKNVLISTTMDLHGNVTDTLFDASDFLTCYRTAPHVDVHETRERGFLHLLDALEHRQPVYRAKVDVPILLPGEKTSTEVEPGKSLYAQIESLCTNEAITDVSIWMGFPWADEQRCHACVVVLGKEEAIVNQTAQKLGRDFWKLRDDFSFVGPTDSLQKAVESALNFLDKPFFISDTGDNPGAGGAGDMNLVLKEFYAVQKQEKLSKKVLFASICDPESIGRIYEKNEGESLLLEVGGKMDRSFGGPLSMEVELVKRFEMERAGQSALVRCDHIFILITQNRFQYGDYEKFSQSSIPDLSDFDIIVVKMGYLEPDLSKAAKGWVMALTNGAVSQDLVNINFVHRKKPLFPFETMDDKIALPIRSQKISPILFEGEQ